jgi:hypothetical protein
MRKKNKFRVDQLSPELIEKVMRKKSPKAENRAEWSNFGGGVKKGCV